MIFVYGPSEANGLIVLVENSSGITYIYYAV
jgi:hypothetical protein